MKFSDFSNEKYRLNSFSVRIKYQPTVPNSLNSSLGVDIYTGKDSLFVDSQYIQTCRMTKCGNVITVYIYFNNLPTNNTTKGKYEKEIFEKRD